MRLLRIFTGLLTLLCGLGAVMAQGQDDWKPPAPSMDNDFDWVELTSGEWLKGEFRYMYDESVEFDSDKLGILTLDWSDIKRIHFNRPMGVRLDDRTVHRGDVVMEDGEIKFLNDTGATTASAKRDQVVSITPKATRERDRWALEANIGFDLQRGNTNETRYTSTINIARRTPSTRLKLDYIGNYTLTDASETANNHRAGATFDYFIDERIYVRAFDGEYYYDPFQNIGIQVTVGAGLGYKLVDTKDIDWEIQVGPAYQYTEFSTVQFGDSQTSQSPAAIFTSDFDYDITDDLDLNITYQAALTNKRSGLLTQHLVSKVEYEITTIFDVFIMLQVDRVENPQTKSDGTTPDKNDITLSFGLGVDI